MLIYGHNSKHAATYQIQGKCPNCDDEQATELSVFVKYGHLFWIPFFPLGKLGFTRCSACGLEADKDQMSYEALKTFNEVRETLRPPIWMFSGLALVFICIIIGLVFDMQDNARYAEYVQNPQNGDFYEIKLDRDKYTLYKVKEVAGDSVFLHMNQYISTGEERLDELYAKDFTLGAFGLHKSTLKKMLDNGDILRVER